MSIGKQNVLQREIELCEARGIGYRVERDFFGNITGVIPVEQNTQTNPFVESSEPEQLELEEEEGQEEELEGCWYVPIPTRKEFISNKAVDYRILGGLMLRSNSNAQFDFLGMNDRGRRYIMGHRMDKIIEEIAETTINPKTKKPLTKSAVSKHIRTLKKLGAREFSLGNWNDKLYYNLQFGEVDEDGNTIGGDFVTISSEKLRALTEAYSSLSIKIYAIMLWKCWDNKNKCYKETHIPYEALIEETGISNRETIHNCIWALEDKFITIRTWKRREHILDSNGEVRSVIRAYNYYNIIEY